MTPSFTILFQSPNRIGLGHLSRLAAIALEVRRASPGVRTPFIVEGDGHGLLAAHGLPELNLPSTFDLYASGRWDDWDRAERHELVQAMATALIHAIAPDVVVFDSFPSVTIAHAAFTLGVPAAVCLRKTKQMPESFERLRQLSREVPLLIVPHAEEECPVPGDLRPRTRFTGTIVRPAPEAGGTFTRAPGTRLIVISGGGGGYEGVADFYNMAIGACTRVRAAHPEVEAALIAGPLFKDWSALDLAAGIRVIPFEPRLLHLFAQADVVICQAGYNTIAEISAIGVPAIVAPAERSSDDQAARARAAAKASSNRIRHYEGSSAEEMAACVVDALQCRVQMTGAIKEAPTRGAALAAASLLELAARRSAHAAASARDD